MANTLENGWLRISGGVFSNGSSPIFVATSKISYRLPRGGKFFKQKPFWIRTFRSCNSFFSLRVAPKELLLMDKIRRITTWKGIRISDMIWMISLDIETGHTT